MKERRSIAGLARTWYGRFERPISSLSLVGGFVFDAVTLTRVDMFWENFWVMAHLAIVVVCIVVINLLENTGDDEANPDKLHFWLVNILQFFFGGLLSVYLVFYFRSGTIATSWPFLAILAAAFIANESLKRRYERLSFQIALLFLSFYALAIYMVPVLTHDIGPATFLWSGAASLAAIGIVLAVLATFSREKFKKSRLLILFGIATIFFSVNGLYFMNLIPPLPLSLKDGDIYHSLIANGPGNYTVTDEAEMVPAPLRPLARYLTLRQTIHLVPGDPLYAYSAIFSPTLLNTTVVHEWQEYDEASGAWITKATIPLSVIGGRDGGYRTYSALYSASPGAWRVNITTPRGGVIGRLRFDVVGAASEPVMRSSAIN